MNEERGLCTPPCFVCLWHHASSNWPGQIDLRQSYLKTIVLHTSFLWAVLLLNEESEMLWPNYYRLACLIYLVFMWMLTFVAEVENKREGRAQTGNIWSKIEKSGPQCDDVFCGKDTWLTEAKIFTQIISIIFFNIFKNSISYRIPYPRGFSLPTVAGDMQATLQPTSTPAVSLLINAMSVVFNVSFSCLVGSINQWK